MAELKRSHWTPLLVALAIALINGLLYVFLARPWQHYDEPTHFEYAKLVADRGVLPLPGDIDTTLRSDIQASMVRHGFFGNPPAMPANLDDAANIGITQLGDSPLYYLYASLAIRLTQDAAIESQLYATRAASLIFLLITVTCGWGVAARVTLPGHRLRWLLPCTLATIPAFVDLMAAVNNDSLAIAAYSLFIVGAVRWLHPHNGERTPFHAANAFWMCGAALLSYAAKSTAVTAVPIAVLVLVVGFFEGRQRLATAAGIALLCSAVIPFAIVREDALGWYRNNASRTSLPIRCDASACGRPVDGDYAIRVSPGTYPHSIAYVFQPFPPAHTARVRGQTVRISAWVWTSENKAVASRAPRIDVNHRIGNSPEIVVTRQPAQIVYTASIPANVHYTRLVLPGHATATLVYDAIAVTPIDDEADALDVEASGASNAVRFASGEARAFALTETANQLLDAVSPEWYSWPLTIASLQDIRGSGWYYLVVLRYMFETLWLRMAWGGTIAHAGWMALATALTAISALGLLLQIVRSRRTDAWPVVILLAICAALTLGPTVPRSIIWGLEERMHAPPIRYALPAVIAFAAALASGWHAFGRRLPERTLRTVCAAVAGTLNVAALVTLLSAQLV